MKDVSYLEELYHIPSAENISDICARIDTKLADIQINTDQQVGPNWLHQPRHSWPCTGEFTRTALSLNETKDPIRIIGHDRLRKSDSPSLSLVLYILDQSRTFTEAAARLARTIPQVKNLRLRLANSD